MLGILALVEVALEYLAEAIRLEHALSLSNLSIGTEQALTFGRPLQSATSAGVVAIALNLPVRSVMPEPQAAHSATPVSGTLLHVGAHGIEIGRSQGVYQ